MLKKLTYFNLIFGVIFFIMQKSNDVPWFEFLVVFFPVFFNWRVLQKLQINALYLNKWDYFFGVLGLIYASILLIVAIILIKEIGAKNLAALILSIKDILFSLSLFIHFTLSVKHSKQKN